MTLLEVALPTYQYACTECGHAFEQVQSFNDDALTVCPECSGRLRKVFNAVGVVFKGSGFYRNDSRGSKESTTTASNGSSESKSDTKTETKSDKKSEPKSDSTPATSGSTSAKKADKASTA